MLRITSAGKARGLSLKGSDEPSSTPKISKESGRSENEYDISCRRRLKAGQSSRTGVTTAIFIKWWARVARD